MRLVSPFIKIGAVQRLIGSRPRSIDVVTRFNLGDFSERVSDLAALRLLLDMGARVRGVRDLHAKLYLFGDNTTIVTSANLTEAALSRNHELGFISDEHEDVAACSAYFDRLWSAAGPDLSEDRLRTWERTVAAHQRARAAAPALPRLKDEGVPVLMNSASSMAPAVVSVGLLAPGLHSTDPASTKTGFLLLSRLEAAREAHIKFFGSASRRASEATRVIHEVERTGCHWACSYPPRKRPRTIRTGATMFMGALVTPDDIRIFGRATAIRPHEVRDRASPADIEARPFKERYSEYVRVRDPVFLATTLGDGVSLNAMMQHLGAESFLSTQDHAERGRGNTNPRLALRQQSGVRLTERAFDWLAGEIDRAFVAHGRIAPEDLEQLA